MDEKLLELIKAATDAEDIDITEDTEFVDDLELSSMQFFNLINSIENAFGIKISDREIQNLETVGDIIEIIEEKK